MAHRKFQNASGTLQTSATAVNVRRKRSTDALFVLALMAVVTNVVGFVSGSSEHTSDEAAWQKVDQESAKLSVEEKLLPLKLSRGRMPNKPVDTIVIHFISDAVKRPEHPYAVEKIIGIMKEYKVSAHYLVDRKGNVIRLVAEHRVAFHSGKGTLSWSPGRENDLNSYSIGIELMGIGTQDEMKTFMTGEHYRRIAVKDRGFTNAQYKSVKMLIADIRKRWPRVELDAQHIVGHDEYAKGRKTDPGSLFDWEKIGVPRTRRSP